MTKVLILCDHRPRRSPSQRYRFEQYLPYLESKGYDFTWSYLLNAEDDKTFYSQGNSFQKAMILCKTIRIRQKDVARFKKFDIIFTQREASFIGTSYFEKKAFQSGAKVIFDFDDSIWLEDTSPGNKKWAWIKKPAKFFQNLKFAHAVVAGNSYLANKATPYNQNTIVIPTTIDTNIHVPRPELRGKEKVIIGWSGSISTIKHFESLLGVLVRIQDKYKEKVGFKIIGQTGYQNKLLDIESVPWTESSEVDELNTMDIGIMPLPDDQWTQGKCGLKGLSYMACEVATVMSNVGVNSEIIESGINGYLATSEIEWFDILSLLIEDKKLREELGKKGRESVLKHYSVEANKDKYLRLFSEVK
jgi:glycosyltransferase involved in cell wall biosynthesis